MLVACHVHVHVACRPSVQRPCAHCPRVTRPHRQTTDFLADFRPGDTHTRIPTKLKTGPRWCAETLSVQLIHCISTVTVTTRRRRPLLAHLSCTTTRRASLGASASRRSAPRGQRLDFLSADKNNGYDAWSSHAQNRGQTSSWAGTESSAQAFCSSSLLGLWLAAFGHGPRRPRRYQRAGSA